MAGVPGSMCPFLKGHGMACCHKHLLWALSLHILHIPKRIRERANHTKLLLQRNFLLSATPEISYYSAKMNFPGLVTCCMLFSSSGYPFNFIQSAVINKRFSSFSPKRYLLWHCN